jgi:FHS family L-fucose permease-like MFS transporter
MSLAFLAIFALGIMELGRNTKPGGSWMVMAILGGAVFSPIEGLISGATHSTATAVPVLLLRYAFIAHCPFFSSRVRIGHPLRYTYRLTASDVQAVAFVV